MNKTKSRWPVHFKTYRFAQPIAGECQIKLRHGLTSWSANELCPRRSMIVRATRANFHLYGSATGLWKLRRKSRVTCLESMNLSNALSSPLVDAGPCELNDCVVIETWFSTAIT